VINLLTNKKIHYMRNLIVILGLLISFNSFSQVDSYGRIDYQKFDKKLFDSLLLNEVNNRRAEARLTPLVFDSICFLSANYQARIMTFKNVTKQIHDVNMDGVKLSSPTDRFEYFNDVNQVLNADKKQFISENYIGINIGVKSKTFTYEKLVIFLLDEFFVGDEITESLYSNLGSDELYGAFSTELKLSDDGYVYDIFVTNVIASK
jgi:hypothetical protein